MPDTHTPPPFEAYRGSEPYVFVSYSHTDSADVFPDLARLHAEGYRIWYDEGIDPGNEWPDEVAKALASAEQFLVFISPYAVASRNVRNEINFALNNGGPFLAVHIVETGLGPGLALRMGDIQAILRHKMKAEFYWRKLEKSLLSRTRGHATLTALTPSGGKPPHVSAAETEPTATTTPDKAPGPADTEQVMDLAQEAERFSQFFVERPDVIAEVEEAATRVPGQTAADFERLLLRLEVKVCAPRQSWGRREGIPHRERLVALIARYDAALEEARLLVAASGEPFRYTEWDEFLKGYQHAIGEVGRIRSAMVKLGIGIFPLVCRAFRQYDSSNAFKRTCDGYDYTWRMDVELAMVMSQLRDLRALPFIAEAVLKHTDEIGRSAWGVGMIRSIQAFGVDPATADQVLKRLVGVTATEILRQQGDGVSHG